jgi:ABC-2 type transport system ATP-binding protein
MDLKIRNITKLFGKQKVLNNIHFDVAEGELLGLLGPNGAGKSTLMKIVTGLMPADSGEVFFGDKILSPSNTELRTITGYLPENNPLYPELYVREYLDITAGIYKLENKKELVSQMIDLTGLKSEQHKKIGALSKGYRQRVGLARALIHDPPVLILDEPTTGLDPNQIEEVRGLIKRISKTKTVILSTHIMQEVEALCSRVVIVNRGNIVADGSISDIRNGNIRKNQVVVAEFDKVVSREQLLVINGVREAVRNMDRWEIESDGSSDIRKDIFIFAVENGLTLLTLAEKQQNLQNIFYRLTSG